MISSQINKVLEDLEKVFPMGNSNILVIGCSTSEVVGEQIGTSGTQEVAQEVFEAFIAFQEKNGVQLAFQCCEHLNRALVVTLKTAKENNLEQVSVVPVRNAGGALASVAFKNLPESIVVESIKADAGIDIGDTFIGMHLKHVAIPVRSNIKEIGKAHVTIAYSRPKLIGGARAIYE